MREWAPRRSAGGRLGRSPQRWHYGSPTDERDQEAEGRSPTPESLTLSVTMIIDTYLRRLRLAAPPTSEADCFAFDYIFVLNLVGEMECISLSIWTSRLLSD